MKASSIACETSLMAGFTNSIERIEFIPTVSYTLVIWTQSEGISTTQAISDTTCCTGRARRVASLALNPIIEVAWSAGVFTSL